MIQSNEIRRGTLFYKIDRTGQVHYPIAFIQKVWTIGLFEVEFLAPGVNPANQEKLFTCAMADMAPVPLTTELLEKCEGFKRVKADDMSWMELKINKQTEIFEGTKNGICEAVVEIGGVEFRLQYLHELQNWHFLLTGREMAINL